MRVLMTTDTVGGVWTFTSELTQELLRRGHHVYLVSFGRRPSPSQEARCHDLWKGSEEQFTVHHTAIPLEWMQSNERAFAEGQEEILDDAACFRPDVILSNQFCFGRLETSVPRVVVAHSDVLSWARACRSSALEPSAWLSRYVDIVQAGLDGAAVVIAPTSWMGVALMEGFSVQSEVVTIPNGVSVTPAPGPQPLRKFQAITAGRLWDEAKGLDTLIDFEMHHLPLLVAGDDSLDSPDPKFAWPRRLTSLGSLSQAELHRYFRESEFYVCTSRYEPFGLAPLEAALCGCIPVLRDLPSLREVWGDDALYFSDNDSLGRTVKALGWDYTLLAEARSRALQRALTYTPERMADGYLGLLETVISNAQASAHVA